MSKKIVIIIPNLCGGGAERLHVNLANDWICRGFRVEFILLRNEGDLIPLLSPKIHITNLNVNRIRDVLIPLAVRLYKSRPQIVLVAMWPLTSVAVFSWMLSGFKGKLFLSDHENLSFSYIQQGRIRLIYLKWIIKLSYPLASGVISVSHGVKNDLLAISNLPEKLINVIHNAAAIGVSSHREDADTQNKLWGIGFYNHILSVGRLTYEKDHATLIRAFAILPKYLNAKLIILGEGPLRLNLETMVHQLNLDESISLPGFVIDPYPWFRSANLFVLSSISEGFGNVIVEALECGVPVVSTCCPGGPREILGDGQYGTLVPVQNYIALASAIEANLNNVFDRKKLISRAEDFSISKVSNEYLAYFFNI